jgi:lipopolysaccharide/colanic/teichoic acid biosynthesis glycosyltransferase
MLKGKNYYPIKRLIDIIGSFFLLVLFSPICLLVALAIKLDSKGPVFADVPERLGKDKKKFKMYKFRSMITNAHYLLRQDPKFRQLYEEYKKGSYKLKNDPRVTRVGKFIRKHSLDEIPQLINVLKGEMSLVGPRAYYSDEYEEQSKKYPHCQKYFEKVFRIKPGITGLWQVSGRSEIDFEKRIKLDSHYAKNLSLWLDLKIILKTPLVMITGKGAV